MRFTKNFHYSDILSRFLSHYITTTCAKACRHKQTRYNLHNLMKVGALLTNMFTRVQEWEQNAAAVRHSPCAASYTEYPSSWKLHNTFRISHHTPPFSSHQVICNSLASASLLLFTQTRTHWHAVRSCRPLLSPSPSQTEWEEFTLAFSFFSQVPWGSCYGDRIQRQLGQPMYTWVGRALRLCSWKWVCVCVCVCLYVLYNT